MSSLRLFGRGPALGALSAAVERACAGHGVLVLVAGEPGIGKTVLVADAADNAAARGVRVAWGRANEGSSTPAFWPWTQVLRAVGSLAPDGHVGAGEPGDDQFLVFDRVIAALDEHSRTAGLIVVLDDLQWADADSLRLLEFVSRQLSGRRLAILCTYRDLEAGGTLRRIAGTAEVVRLEGLSTTHVAAMMSSLIGADVNLDSATRLRDRTGGNPLFVRELTRLTQRRGGGDLGDMTGLVDSVRGVIERRVTLLSGPCSRLLALAALDGAEIRAGVLGVVLDDPTTITELIDEAVAAGLLVDDAGTVHFAHDLFREVLAAGMIGTERRRTHLAIGEALERVGASNPGELAAQFAAAGDGERAVRYGLLAAAESTARLGFDDAVGHLERALQALGGASADPVKRLGLVADLADAQRSAGRLVDAAATYRAAETLARHIGDQPARARAAIGLHRVGIKTGPSRERDAQTGLLESIATALPRDADVVRAHVLAALARTLLHSMSAESMGKARPIAEEAVLLARRSGDGDALVDALLALHDASWAPGTAARRLRVLDELDRLDEADRAHVRLLRAEALLELGDPACHASLDEFCVAAERAGTPTARWRALSRRSAAALIVGRFDHAAELLDRAGHIAQLTGDADGIWIGDIQRWELARFTGGRAAYDRRHPDSDPPVESWAPWRALILSDAGDREAAQAAMAGFPVARAYGPGVDAGYDLWFPSIAADAATRCGTDELRADLYDLLAPYAGTHVGCGAFVTYAGPVDYYLGELAATLDRKQRARAHRTAAVEQLRILGAASWSMLIGPTSDEPAKAAFHRTGALWTMSFAGIDAVVPDARGFRDIAALLAHPHQPVAATVLAGITVPSRGDPVLDRRALADYRARLRDLAEDIVDADDEHDPQRAARARLEHDTIIDELQRSSGLGQRVRRLGDDNEKARKTVTTRIRRAISALHRSHPALANHLDATIDTGNSCTYRPSEQIRWQL